MRLLYGWKNFWHKLWSVRLAAIFGIVSTVLCAQPDILIGLVAFIPHTGARFAVAAFVGLVVFVIPTVTRLVDQPKLDK